MTTNIDTWTKTIAFIKDNYPVHLWYSLAERWCYLSYKGERIRIEDSWSVDEIKDRILLLTKIKWEV